MPKALIHPTEYKKELQNTGLLGDREKLSVAKCLSVPLRKVLQTNFSSNTDAVPITDWNFKVSAGTRYYIEGALFMSGFSAGEAFSLQIAPSAALISEGIRGFAIVEAGDAVTLNTLTAADVSSMYLVRVVNGEVGPVTQIYFSGTFRAVDTDIITLRAMDTAGGMQILLGSSINIYEPTNSGPI